MSMAIPCRSVLLTALSPPTDTHALPARRISPRRLISLSRHKGKSRRAFLQFTPLLVRSTTLSNNSFTDLRDALPSSDASQMRITESLLGIREANRRHRASNRCYGPFFSAYKSHSPSDRRCPLVSLRQRPPPLREYILQLPKLPMPRSSR